MYSTKIARHGEEYRFQRFGDMLVASNYAGIAFGNAGVGAVHACRTLWGQLSRTARRGKLSVLPRYSSCIGQKHLRAR